MREPALWPPAQDQTVIRLLIMPSFESPTLVRAVKERSRYRLLARRTIGESFMWTLKRREVRLSADDSTKLEELLAAAMLPDPPPPKDWSGWDGEEWIVETVRDGKYRVKVRWSPDFGTAERGLTAFVEFSNFLLNASTLNRPWYRDPETYIAIAIVPIYFLIRRRWLASRPKLPASFKPRPFA